MVNMNATAITTPKSPFLLFISSTPFAKIRFCNTLLDVYKPEFINIAIIAFRRISSFL